MPDLPLSQPAPRTLVPAWRGFVRFVQAPQPLRPMGLAAPGALGGWLAMLLLHLAAMAVLLPVIALWQRLFGLEAPDAFAKFPREWLLPTVVLFAPMVEETLFRGWLTGRPRALWLLGLAVAGVAAIALMGPTNPRLGIVLIGLLIAALAGWLVLRKQPGPAALLARHFGWVFYAVVLAFGTMHVFNYPHPSLLVLPMVLPQLCAGLTLGYVRMRFGLPASMLLHVTSNALALGAALAGGI